MTYDFTSFDKPICVLKDFIASLSNYDFRVDVHRGPSVNIFDEFKDNFNIFVNAFTEFRDDVVNFNSLEITKKVYRLDNKLQGFWAILINDINGVLFVVKEHLSNAVNNLINGFDLELKNFPLTIQNYVNKFYGFIKSYLDLVLTKLVKFSKKFNSFKTRYGVVYSLFVSFENLNSRSFSSISVRQGDVVIGYDGKVLELINGGETSDVLKNVKFIKDIFVVSSFKSKPSFVAKVNDFSKNRFDWRFRFLKDSLLGFKSTFFGGVRSAKFNPIDNRVYFFFSPSSDLKDVLCNIKPSKSKYVFRKHFSKNRVVDLFIHSFLISKVPHTSMMEGFSVSHNDDLNFESVFFSKWFVFNGVLAFNPVMLPQLAYA